MSEDGFFSSFAGLVKFLLPQPKPRIGPLSSAPLPPVKNSRVAGALAFFAVLDFIGAVIGGLAAWIADESAVLGWLIFVCCVLSGLILLGFAHVIEHVSQSAQRLQRIEMLIQRSHAEHTDAA